VQLVSRIIAVRHPAINLSRSDVCDVRHTTLVERKRIAVRAADWSSDSRFLLLDPARARLVGARPCLALKRRLAVTTMCCAGDSAHIASDMSERSREFHSHRRNEEA